jgi:hypothetical protein
VISKVVLPVHQEHDLLHNKAVCTVLNPLLFASTRLSQSADTLQQQAHLEGTRPRQFAVCHATKQLQQLDDWLAVLGPYTEGLGVEVWEALQATCGQQGSLCRGKQVAGRAAGQPSADFCGGSSSKSYSAGLSRAFT